MTRPAVLTHPLLDGARGVKHAFFSRAGGVSEGIYAGLNVGRGSRDDPAAVEENRRRAASVFDRPEGDLLTCHQIHSAIAHVAGAPFGVGRPEGDAVVTRTSGLICGALSADCAPILLADARAGVVAAAHAGWKGALTGVAEATVSAMEAEGADRRRITAVVGPCIGPASYEVGLEFLQRFLDDAPGSEVHFSTGVRPDKRLFDLPGFVLARLRSCGVTEAEWIGVDTCAEEGYFSNRRAFQRGEPDYGRLLSAIMLV
jgi:YfiH family protein